MPITNDDINRSGWRYYQVSDINSQLGFLRWQLDLDAAHQAGREIALRRNAVPARWSYRTGNSAYSTGVSESYHMDVTSNYGFLQRSGHQADIWYIGINTPNQAMGPFQLTTREIPAPIAQVNSSTSTVTSQIANTWPTGWQWAPGIGDMYYTGGYGMGGTGMGGPTHRYSGDKNSYLIVEMGSPLEAGTYYVGVSGNGSDTAALSYTMESRGIGNDAGGTPWPIQVQDLGNFAGGSVNCSNLAPREAAYYRVTVPAGAKSWSMKLEPTVEEALMTIRQGVVPNMMAYNNGLSDASSGYGYDGTRRQKDGREFFYKYAVDPQTAITSGTYYIAVFSEGQDAADNGMIPFAYPTYIAHEGGYAYTWSNDTLITIPQPMAGDYTLTMADRATQSGDNYIYPDAAYGVEVTAQTATALILDNGSASSSLVDQQIQYYQVTIPAIVNGYPLAG